MLKQWCKRQAGNKRNYAGIARRYFFLCCTKDRDVEFFWRTYTPNRDGVRLELSVDYLLSEFAFLKGASIRYEKRNDISRLIRNIEASDVAISKYFYTKRHAFRTEYEYRFHLIRSDNEDDTFDLAIDPRKLIKRVVFDPRMSKEVFELHKKFIHAEIPSTKIYRSNLLDPEGTFEQEDEYDPSSELSS